MVLYKRKPIEFLDVPIQVKNAYAAEIWEIRETGEVFVYYEEYLSRREFYLQKLFSCEVTGRTGLTFFDALESEHHNTREIETSFPESLRGPILKRVHFSTIGRLEQLVNWIYDSFKHDFYPRENVICIKDSGERSEGTVREKITYPEQRRPDGSVACPSFSKYIIAMKSNDKSELPEEGFYEDQNVTRDRKNFSKHLLRHFLKNALTKELWIGAPWIVKEGMAREFDLPLEVPPHLQQSARVAEKKALAQQKKAAMGLQDPDQGGGMFTITDFRSSQNGRKNPAAIVPAGTPALHRPWQSKPNPKQKHRFIQHNIQTYQPGVEQQFVQYQQVHPDLHPVQYAPNGNGHMQAIVMYTNDQPSYPQGTVFHQLTTLPIQRKDRMPSPPPPPQIKYPIEDLDVQPKETTLHRPALKFFTEQEATAQDDEEDETHSTGKLNMKSMGPLLEVWNTLNVHNEVFILDSFTLDDFAEAMRFSSQEVECELLTEVHCAILKQLVDDKGVLMVDLPPFEESDESSSSEEESSDEAEPEAEPEPPRRTTRSSLAKAAELAKERSPSPENLLAHLAADLQADHPWQERCKDREFSGNMWQPILTGLLYQISLNDRMKDRCDNILSKLLPPDMEATDETVLAKYTTLDVNLRLDALEIIVMLSVRTKAIREQLEKMSQEMTDLRKRKIEQQRMKKDLVDQLHELDDQRKTLVQESAPAPTTEEAEKEEKKEDIDTPMAEVRELNGKSGGSSDGSDDEIPRMLRRGNERKRKREEVAVQKEKQKKAKAAATKLSKQELKLKKLMDQIEYKKDEIKECEDAIADLNNDLRETDCQRTKCLGRDRFCNRYYWFERNGMPFGGVPDTSTSHYGYANGRIWVQGPDPMERAGLIDLPKDEQDKYSESFGMTIIERMEMEEGSTHLDDAVQWGYYDDPDSVDQLIAWLDERGLREKQLRKEMTLWRDIIVECMGKMRSHLDEEDAKRKQDDEVPAMRISTRTKTYVDLDTTKWRCLAWKNTTAIDEFGMRHGDGLKKPRKRGVAEVKGKIALDKKGKAAKKGK